MAKRKAIKNPLLQKYLAYKLKKKVKELTKNAEFYKKVTKELERASKGDNLPQYAQHAGKLSEAEVGVEKAKEIAGEPKVTKVNMDDEAFLAHLNNNLEEYKKRKNGKS